MHPTSHRNSRMHHQVGAVRCAQNGSQGEREHLFLVRLARDRERNQVAPRIVERLNPVAFRRLDRIVETLFPILSHDAYASFP